MIENLYVDIISSKSFFTIVNSKAKRIYELESKEKGSDFFRKILSILGKEIIFLDFFTGQLYTKGSNEPVYIKARKEANILAFKHAKEIVKNINLLNKFNNLYGNNTIVLYLSKFLQVNLFEWTLKILAYKAISINSKNSKILINSPKFFSRELLKEAYPEIKISYYNKIGSYFLGLIFILTKELYLNFKSKFSIKYKSKIQSGNFINDKSILSFQEESIRKEQSLRGHLHWLDFSVKNKSYDSHIISLPSQPSIKLEDKLALEEKNYFIHDKYIFRVSKKLHGNDKRFIPIKRDIFELCKSFLKSRVLDNIFNIKIIFLMQMAIDLASICIYLKAKVFVIKEPYFMYSDAIQLISNKIGIKTLAYQYSNLGYFSPLMVASSDIFLIFSPAYKKLFKKNQYGPSKIIPMGYVNEGIEHRFSKRVFDLKSRLKSKGVKFTIAYFDESIQKDRWGLIKEVEFQKHIIIFSEKVISDTSLAVLIKSQFIYNLIQEKFNDIPIIKEAFQTGRLIEIHEGNKRNDVYPMEIAKCADISINHLIGATAGLEVAIAGSRCILLNEHNYHSIHQAVYEKENIIYNDLNKALKSIKNHREKLKNNISSNLGDWSNCLGYFVGEKKRTGIHKIKNVVETLLV